MKLWVRQGRQIKGKPMIRNMLKLISEFLRNPSDFFQDRRRQRVAVISVFSLLFVCVLFSIARSAARQRNTSLDPDVDAITMSPPATQTKWWIRREPSETPTSSIASLETQIIATAASAGSSECPDYAADFKPGTFAYISLFPAYENLIRSGAGKNYSAIGFIEIGGWVRILAEPVCAVDGYVWLNVESASDSSSWTAGGRETAQWVIPCPDPKKKCSKNKPTGSISTTPSPNGNRDVTNRTSCVSNRLAIGLDAQVSPNDLLVLRSEPLTGSVLGHLAPLTVVNILDGPNCAGGAVWWKVLGTQTGWAVENSLLACPKEGECDPWKNK